MTSRVSKLPRCGEDSLSGSCPWLRLIRKKGLKLPATFCCLTMFVWWGAGVKVSLEMRSLAGRIGIGSGTRRRTAVWPMTAVVCGELGTTWPVVSELGRKWARAQKISGKREQVYPVPLCVGQGNPRQALKYIGWFFHFLAKSELGRVSLVQPWWSLAVQREDTRPVLVWRMARPSRALERQRHPASVMRGSSCSCHLCRPGPASSPLPSGQPQNLTAVSLMLGTLALASRGVDASGAAVTSGARWVLLARQPWGGCCHCLAVAQGPA